jgi:hypothetical protein
MPLGTWILAMAWGSICTVWAMLLVAQRQIRRLGLILRPDDGSAADSMAVRVYRRAGKE